MKKGHLAIGALLAVCLSGCTLNGQSTLKSSPWTIAKSSELTSLPSDSSNSLTQADTQIKDEFVIDLSNGNSNSFVESGSFKAKNDDLLNIKITSTASDGSAYLSFFSPHNEEQKISIENVNITHSGDEWASFSCNDFFTSKDINIDGSLTLSEGEWTYTCNGSGDIKVVGSIE